MRSVIHPRFDTVLFAFRSFCRWPRVFAKRFIIRTYKFRLKSSKNHPLFSYTYTLKTPFPFRNDILPKSTRVAGYARVFRRSAVSLCSDSRRDRSHRHPSLPPAGSQRWQRKFRRDFLTLHPVVVGVAFKTPRLRVLSPSPVARFASCDAWQKHVVRLRTRQSRLVTAHAGKSAMRVVIENCVRHPLRNHFRRRHLRQRGIALSSKSIHLGQRCTTCMVEPVTLAASFAPQQFFGFRGPFAYPLPRRQEAHFRQDWLSRQIPFGVARHANFRGMRRNVFLKVLDEKCVNDLRFVMRHAAIKTFIERKQMTGCASRREFHRRHQLASRFRSMRLQQIRRLFKPRSWRRRDAL